MSRAALALAIRGYRRWLSGRGPLRRVRCTFHHNESCSAFGLRSAHEAPSLRSALGRIRRRLRRCRDASLFALDGAGGRALGWGAAHERALPELVAELTADREQAAAQATVLGARLTVARWRGDLLDAVAVTDALRELPRVPLVLRRPPSARALAALLAWRLWPLPLAALLAVVSVPLALTLGALITARVGLALWAHLGRAARLRAQAQAAALRAQPLAAPRLRA